MARPRAFDRDQALKKAMAVFWEKGYEATSTDDLLRAMGVGRQSLYDTFGDKHRLYLEALRLYEASRGGELFRRIQEASSPFAAISDYILSIADRTPADRARGCFFVNATNEVAPSDPVVATVVRTSNTLCEAAFERILREAKQRGEVDPCVDERVAAQYLMSAICGLCVSAKAGVGPEDLRAVARMTLSSLKPR